MKTLICNKCGACGCEDCFCDGGCAVCNCEDRRVRDPDNFKDDILIIDFATCTK